MITGAFSTEEKDRCKTFLDGKYKPSDILEVHMTQHEKSINVEVIVRHTHHLRKKVCGSYEEYALPLNDR